jgi:TATA-box binding protein (TBP) (component of TFIID and TFIIIB)
MSNSVVSRPYRVSTITATGSLGCLINLDKLFQNIDQVANAENILYVEFGRRKFDNSYCKGQAKKVIQMGNKQKRFDNQVTVLYKDDRADVYVSAKIFKNGNLQMTGIKNCDQGDAVMKSVRDIVMMAYKKDPEVVAGDVAMLERPSNYSIRMINSDFKMGFPIRRDLLYKAWLTEYKHICSYEPCIYQGVKIQYFFNMDKGVVGAERDGICKCAVPCSLRRKNEDVPCRKVTIAVFQSGSVIVTGGRSLEQIDEVYEFIKGALTRLRPRIEDHAKQVAGESVVPIAGACDKTSMEPQKVLIKKANIIYPRCRQNH